MCTAVFIEGPLAHYKWISNKSGMQKFYYNTNTAYMKYMGPFNFVMQTLKKIGFAFPLPCSEMLQKTFMFSKL